MENHRHEIELAKLRAIEIVARLFGNNTSKEPKCPRVKNGRDRKDSIKKDINLIPPIKQGFLGTSFKRDFLNKQPTFHRKLSAKEKGKSPLGESSWCDTGDPPFIPDKLQTRLSYSRAELLNIRVLNPLPLSSLSMKKDQIDVVNNLMGEMKHDKRQQQNHYRRTRKKAIVGRDFILLNRNLSKSLKPGQEFQFYHHQSCSRVIIGVKKVANSGELSANEVGVSTLLAENGRGEEDDHVVTKYNNVAAKDDCMVEAIENFSNEVTIGCSSPETVTASGVPNEVRAGGSPFPCVLNVPTPQRVPETQCALNPQVVQKIHNAHFQAKQDDKGNIQDKKRSRTTSLLHQDFNGYLATNQTPTKRRCLQQSVSNFPFCRGKCSLSRLAPLEAILFDIDGTLCDSDPLHYYAFREMLQEIGFNGGVPITEEYFVKNIAGKHNEDIADLLFPDDHQRGMKFLDDKEAMFRKLASEQVKPIDGLYKLRKWVEDRGLKRAAVTNAPKANAELMLSILGLSDFFHAVILGDECARAKPFPDPYLKALEVLNVSKDHTFVFEDSVSGIKAGVAAGMPVVGLTTRNPEHLLMVAKPAFLIKDYEDTKLWAALEEIDRKSGGESNIAA